MSLIATKIRPNYPKTTEIILKIRGMENQKGKIMVALFDSEANFPERPFRRITASISDDLTAEVRFENLEARFYALSVLHSASGSSQPEVNFLGMPTEKYGFSNNKYGIFGKFPDFEQAKFEANGKTFVEIRIRNIREVLSLK